MPKIKRKQISTVFVDYSLVNEYPKLKNQSAIQLD